jgi:hypothetical protein
LAETVAAETPLAKTNDRHWAPLHGARSPGGWRTATMALAAAPKQRSSVMKTIISALVALSALTGVAASANAAWDAKVFWEELDRART